MPVHLHPFHNNLAFDISSSLISIISKFLLELLSRKSWATSEVDKQKEGREISKLAKPLG